MVDPDALDAACSFIKKSIYPLCVLSSGRVVRTSGYGRIDHGRVPEMGVFILTTSLVRCVQEMAVVDPDALDAACSFIKKSLAENLRAEFQKVLIPQKALTKSFCKSQFPHRSVTLSLLSVMMKKKLTDLCGN